MHFVGFTQIRVNQGNSLQCGGCALYYINLVDGISRLLGNTERGGGVDNVDGRGNAEKLSEAQAGKI